MKSLFEVFQDKKISNTTGLPSTIKSERASVIKQFIDELILERRYDNYRRFLWMNRKLRARGQKPLTPDLFKKTDQYLKPLQAGFIAIKIAHLSLSDLYYFLSVCKDAKSRGRSFSKHFFGSIKVFRVDNGSIEPKLAKKLSPYFI